VGFMCSRGKALGRFLLGRWALDRKLDYRVGGGQGTLQGIATFTEASEKLPGVLLYEERGEVQLSGLPPMSVYRFYCFNTTTWPVEVYFVDDPTKSHLETLLPALKGMHTSFFHDLPFNPGGDDETTLTTPVSTRFEHLCVDDLYSGNFEVFPTGDTFQWNWSIVGPSKDGTISSSYHRLQSKQ